MQIVKILALILFGFYIQMLEGWVLFPVSDDIKWSLAVPNQMECRSFNPAPAINSGQGIKGLAPILSQEYKIEGYQCVNVKLHTRCSKGFFGNVDIEHIEEHSSTSEFECLNAIHVYKSGEQKLDDYPLESCSWLKTSTESKQIFHITTRSLTYDPYYNSAISELFPSGRCNTSICKTIFPGQLWVSDFNTKPKCISDHLNQILFLVKNNGRSVYDFWSPDIDIVSGHAICRKEYCGVNGLLFGDKSWIGLVNESSIGDKQVRQYLSTISLCNETERLSEFEKSYSVHVAEKTLIDQFMYQECQKVKLKLIDGTPISRVELQTLGPRAPGLHRVYRLNDGVLETGMSYYKFGYLVPMSGNNPQLFKTQDGKLMKWKYWVQDHHHKIIDGPNGIYIYKGEISIASSNIENYRLAVSTSLKQTVKIEMPKLYSGINQTEGWIKRTYSHLSDKSLSDLELFDFGDWVHWIAKGIVMCIVVLLLCMTFRVLIPLLKHKLELRRLRMMEERVMDGSRELKVLYKP